LLPARAKETRDGLASVTGGTLLVGATTAALVGCTLLSRVLLVRSPAADWNSFSLELTISGVLGTAGTLGLPSAVAWALPHASHDSERRTVVRTSILATAVVGVILGVSLWLAAPSLARVFGIPNLSLGLEAFSVSISTSLLSGIIVAIFRGYSDAFPNAILLQVVNPGLFLVLLLVAFEVPAVGLTYSVALIAYASASGVTLGLAVIYYVRRLPRHLPPGPRAPEYRGRLLRYAAPLYVSAVLVTIAGSGDTIILGVFHPSEVGVYTASLTLARLVQIGVSSASYILLPVATRLLRRENEQGVHLIYATVTKWLLAFSLPLFALFVVLPQQSLDFVYGPAYTSIVMPLQITVAAAFGTAVLGPSAATQIAYGQLRAVAINSVLAGGADVALAIVLVPAHGYTGAAAAWAISTLLFTALCLSELAVLNGMTPFSRHLGIPLLSTLLPSALALFLLRGIVPEWILPLLGLAVAGAFFLSAFLTKSIDEGDRLLLGVVEGMIGRPVPLIRRLARFMGLTR